MPDAHRPPTAATAAQPPREPAAEPDIRALFDEFATRTAPVVPAVDLPAVRTRSERRLAVRWVVAAAAGAALVLPVSIYVLTRPAVDAPLGNPVVPTPEPPAGFALAPQQSTMPRSSPPGTQVASAATPSLPSQSLPSPLPSPSLPSLSLPSPSLPSPSLPPVMTSPISGTDWANATLDIPANQTGCASGRAQFRQGTADVGESRYQFGGGPEMTFEAAYGDVDADGQAEALVVMSCMTPTHRNPPSIVLLVTAVPALHTMALAFTTGPRVTDGEGRSIVSAPAIAADGTMTFQVRTYEGNGQCEYRQHWTGTAVVGTCDP